MGEMMIAFVISTAVTLLVVRFAPAIAHLTHDHDTDGPQKFHSRPVPRIGGLGVLAGLCAGLSYMYFGHYSAHGQFGWILLAAAGPAFVSGFVEDLTKSVSPRRRLVATGFSAVLAAWWLDALIRHTSLPGIDWIVGFSAGALIVTIVAVAGVANSINIIDGFNGLASMCSIMMLASLAYVALQVGDSTIAALALMTVGSIFGFFIWNFPLGLVFLGDGGAYLIGFVFAELSVLLVARNADVSPLFPLLVCIYPVFETIFSIYRRRFVRDVSPAVPDGIHLHSLIYRRLMRWAVGSQSAKALTRRNSMTSPYLWMLCMVSVVPATLFWDETIVLSGFLLGFVVLYVRLYRRIVRFKVPRWLVLRKAGSVVEPTRSDEGDR